MSDTNQSDKKLCFVIGPIGDDGTDVRQHADWLLDGIIIPVFAEHFSDFRPERADKIGEPGMITSQIITRLMEAPLVVADMSLHNANAFYELAIRHMVRLPTIHMIIKGSKVPFDVAPHRAVPFSIAHYQDVVQARTDLKAAVEEAIKPSFQVENPITHARGRLELERHATPEMKVLMDAMESFGRRLAKIEVIQDIAERERDAKARALLGQREVTLGLPVGRSNAIGLSLGKATSNAVGLGLWPGPNDK